MIFFEADANRSVWGLLRRWMQWGKGFAAAGANMKSGLKVAKCGKDDEIVDDKVPGKADEFLYNLKSDLHMEDESNRLVKYFQDNPDKEHTINDGEYHGYGQYNYLLGAHKIVKGNTPKTIAYRYYKTYIDSSEKINDWEKQKLRIYPVKLLREYIGIKKSEIEKLKGEKLKKARLHILYHAMDLWNVWTGDRDPSKFAGHKMAQNKAPIIIGKNIYVNPIAFNRGQGNIMNSELKKQPKFKVDPKEKSIHYVLTYTFNNMDDSKEFPSEEQDNFYHVFTSYIVVQSKKDTSDKTTLITKVGIDNNNLTSKVALKYEDGQNSDNDDTRKLNTQKSYYQVYDDILWFEIERFIFLTKGLRAKDAQGKGAKLYTTAMNPTKRPKIEQPLVKQVFTQVSNIVVGVGMIWKVNPLIELAGTAMGLATQMMPDTVKYPEATLYYATNKEEK